MHAVSVGKRYGIARRRLVDEVGNSYPLWILATSVDHSIPPQSAHVHVYLDGYRAHLSMRPECAAHQHGPSTRGSRNRP